MQPTALTSRRQRTLGPPPTLEPETDPPAGASARGGPSAASSHSGGPRVHTLREPTAPGLAAAAPPQAPHHPTDAWAPPARVQPLLETLRPLLERHGGIPPIAEDAGITPPGLLVAGTARGPAGVTSPLGPRAAMRRIGSSSLPNGPRLPSSAPDSELLGSPPPASRGGVVPPLPIPRADVRNSSSRQPEQWEHWGQPGPSWQQPQQQQQWPQGGHPWHPPEEWYPRDGGPAWNPGGPPRPLRAPAIRRHLYVGRGSSRAGRLRWTQPGGGVWLEGAAEELRYAPAMAPQSLNPS